MQPMSTSDPSKHAPGEFENIVHAGQGAAGMDVIGVERGTCSVDSTVRLALCSYTSRWSASVPYTRSKVNL